MISVERVNAAITRTVTTNSDLPNLYPGGQTHSTTSGDFRYCINYILDQQAQGIVQDYSIVFDPGIEAIQLGSKQSTLNLLGSSTIAIGNPDSASPVTIIGRANTGRLFIRQGSVTLQNLNFQDCNSTGGTGGKEDMAEWVVLEVMVGLLMVGEEVQFLGLQAELEELD